jgi:hypothetical protein
MGVRKESRDERPIPTGWPPPTDVDASMYFVPTFRDDRKPLPIKKRDIYPEIRAKERGRVAP